jgi:hypothetical protein
MKTKYLRLIAATAAEEMKWLNHNCQQDEEDMWWYKK